MPLPSIIAIDGPAASGKSTIGKTLADELGYLFFDTGIMYRAVTWAAVMNRIPFEDETSITRLAETIVIDIRTPSIADGRDSDVLMDGKDITWEIRKPEVDRNVSLVSSYSGVRNALSLQQRRIGLRGRVVMVGRDIGTVVMPEAGLKIFLIASAEERARRRHAELRNRGSEQSYEEILSAMVERDMIDSTRVFSPLKAADDAVILDTDQMDIPLVMGEVRRLLNRMAHSNNIQSDL